MHDAPCMDAWDAAVTAYMTSRHAIGRAYRKEEVILCQVRGFLLEAGAIDLDLALFERWRAQFQHLSSSTRVVREHTVYKFYRYRRRSDPGCFLPDWDSLTRQKPHALPTIIEPGQVAQLLAFVSQQPPRSQFFARSHVMRLAVVLLYTAGLRRGEVVRLTLGDVDERTGVLRIRASKFHKSRWVPLSISAHAELRRYLAARRQAHLDERPEAPLLCTCALRAYTAAGLYTTFKGLLRRAGIRDRTGKVPRLQDFRHSFAVAALLRWYEADADVQSNLPKLALYMGHVNIVSTAYYLRWMPAVVSQASARFERSCAGMIEGGVA